MSVVPSRYCAPLSMRKKPRPTAGVRRFADTIVRHRRVGTRRGNRREGNLLEGASLASKPLQLDRRGDLGHFSPRRIAIEPFEKAHQRGAVAQMRLRSSGQLNRVLARLQQRDRVRDQRADSAAGFQDVASGLRETSRRRAQCVPPCDPGLRRTATGLPAPTARRRRQGAPAPSSIASVRRRTTSAAPDFGT